MIDLSAIRKRCEAATAKPWTVRDNDGFWCGRLLAPNSEGVPIPLMHFDFTPTCRDHLSETWSNDLEFIAHAREDIPALLGEVERMQDDLAYAWGLTVDEHGANYTAEWEEMRNCVDRKEWVGAKDAYERMISP